MGDDDYLDELMDKVEQLGILNGSLSLRKPSTTQNLHYESFLLTNLT